MSAAKHTPGPWVLTDEIGQSVEAVKGGRTMAVAHTTAYCEAHGESRLANARVISAAPALLDAAASLLAERDRYFDLPLAQAHSDDNEARALACFEALRAAVDQARGVSQ